MNTKCTHMNYDHWSHEHSCGSGQSIGFWCWNCGAIQRMSFPTFAPYPATPVPELWHLPEPNDEKQRPEPRPQVLQGGPR